MPAPDQTLQSPATGEAHVATSATAHSAHWHCLDQAHQPLPGTRMSWAIHGQVVGTVAREHVQTLLAWPEVFALVGDVLHCQTPAALPELTTALHAQGLIRGWRNETYAIHPLAQATEQAKTEAPLALVERASCFFFGFQTHAAHATGYVADEQGRPQALWIARRSESKATDPGKLDNLVGGGIPHGQTPREAFEREAWEEAGLRGPVVQHAVAVGSLLTQREVPQGRQNEELHCFDILLPAGQSPHNQDGEVSGVELLQVPRALAVARSDEMTVDAALVTLDFALRHGLLPPEEAALCSQALAPLRGRLPA